jgi:hypothetical protein
VNYSYVLNSIFWSLFGGGAGYYIGRLRRDVSRIQERVDEVSDDDIEPAPAHRRRHRGLLGHLEDNYPAVGIVVVVMALATVSLVVYQKLQLDHVTRCYIIALQIRDRDTSDSRQFAINYAGSTETMIDNILSTAQPPGSTQQPTPEQRAEVVTAITTWKNDNHTYRTALQKAQDNARQNPLFTTSCR